MSDFGLFPDAETTIAAAPALSYRVLARKYRPTKFGELIGQEALVRTLTNAIASNRVAHAFMLTGVRGVGKTTTARIIARALNCVGADGMGGPTIEPCGVCPNCVSISQDRHVDVIEMDAASRTGIDDIREVIEGVRYAPVSARYKIYIVDEVHMLSKQAFNALLKTLEEPPPHVKFVFATTEIRKVPVTVLSRCQRFDLRRVDAEVLIGHFTRLLGAEGAEAAPEAVSLIARAADGSVRDGLSLLDQAIALASGPVTVELVRDMLGLADRTIVLDLFEAVVKGKVKDALEILTDLHRAGAEPAVVIQDLLDLTHSLTRFKAVPDIVSSTGLPEAERVRGAELAKGLSVPTLTRAWQILLKGLAEVQQAPVAQQAAEMVILRLAYAADLPTPAELVKQAQGHLPGKPSSLPHPRPQSEPRPGPSSSTVSWSGGGSQAAMRREPEPQSSAVADRPEIVAETPVLPQPQSFTDVVALFGERREGTIFGNLKSAVHLVRFEIGLIEIRPEPQAPRDLASRVSALLTEWTGRRWMVSLSNATGEPTLAEQERANKAQSLAMAEQHPVVQAVMQHFPGATIIEVRDLKAEAAAQDLAEAERAGLIGSDADEQPSPELADASEENEE